MWNVLQLIFALFTFSITPCLFAWRVSEDCDPINLASMNGDDADWESLFFPMLFEYYYYQNIDYGQFQLSLLLFNLPKVLILFVRKIWIMVRIWFSCWSTHFLLCITPPTLILPLLPWQWSTIYHFKCDESDAVSKWWYGPFNLGLPIARYDLFIMDR